MRHNLVGKVIFFEFKWYMYNPESVLENETHKVVWDFEIQANHLILARKPDQVIVNQKERTCQIVDFAILAKTERKQKER